ncbi:D-galactonate transporter [Encephalitozoon hellem]|uniref:Lysosomal dipeptide transporter MFSD1 n=1 Tax=Encephalitozoon hellem TaxID=27973 RepID=A0ABY8CLG7_ENCHE|nr:D-galactonate transporter [Encephalitozoon hellem]
MKERHRVLLLSGLILFSFYFVYDIPSALSHHVSFGSDSGIEYKITLLYSVYSLPNIIVPIFFGWITHVKKSTLAKLLCTFVFLGHLIFTAGVWSRSFKIMLIGRFLFGVGGESFAVIQNKLISYEFKGKELGFAMGIFSCIARLGTVANFLFTPFLADTVGRMFPCVIGIFLTLLGLWVCFRINSSERSHKILKQKLIDLQKEGFGGEAQDRRANPGEGFLNDPGSAAFSEAIGPTPKSTSNALNIPESPFFHDYSESKPKELPQEDPILFDSPFSPWKGDSKESTTVKSRLEKAKPKVLFEESGMLFYEPRLEGKNTHHSAFYILVGMSFLFALIWSPFYTVAPMLFQKRYGLSAVSSGNILATIEGTSLVLITFTSAIADAYGFKLWLIMAGCILFLIGHSGIFFNFLSPYASATLLGFSGPLIACYWPCIPSLVSEESLGTGFATIYCILNLAFTFSPVVVAFLATGDDSYDNVEAYILVIGTLALILVGFLFYLNKKQSLGLNRKTLMEAD